MSVTARKITVVVGGSSGELIDAIAKAQDALKGMADTLLKVSDTSVKANETTIDSNSDVAKSYDDMVASVKSAGVEVVQSLRTQMDAQQKTGESAGVAAAEISTAADRQVEAMAAIARAAIETADTAGESSDRIVKSAGAAADAARGSADAIKESAGITEDAYYGTADAAATVADRQVEASGAVATAANESAAAQRKASDANIASAGKTADANETAFAASSGALVKLGKATVLAGLAVGAASLDVSAKFEQSMTRVRTQAGASAKEVAYFEKGILGLTGKVEATETQMAGGMYWLASAGLKGKDAMEALKASIDLSEVSGADLGETAKTTSTIIVDLKQHVNEYAKDVGLTNATVGAGKLTLEEYNKALGSGLLAAADAAGVGLPQVDAALATITRMGIPATRAATGLRMAFQKLASVKEYNLKGELTEQGAALHKFGLDSTEVSEMLGKPDGFIHLIEKLHEKLKGISGPQRSEMLRDVEELAGGVKSGTVFQALVEHPEELQSTHSTILAQNAAFHEKLVAQEHTLSGQLKMTWSGLKGDLSEFGKDLTPFSEVLLSDLRETAAWFGHNKTAAEALAGVVAGGLSVAVAAFTANRLAKLVEGLKQVGMASRYLRGGFASPSATSGTTAGVGGAGSVVSKIEGGGMIGGVLTPGMLPGSESNPIATVQMAAERFGLGGQAAAIGAKTEETTAAEASAATGAASSEVPVAEEALAGGGLVASLKGIVGPLIDGAMKGGMIAGVGVLGSQIAGSAIGGKTGKDVSSIGTDAAIGAGIGTVIEPGIGTAIGGGLGGIVGAIKALQPPSKTEAHVEAAAKGLPANLNKDAVAQLQAEIGGFWKHVEKDEQLRHVSPGEAPSREGSAAEREHRRKAEEWRKKEEREAEHKEGAAKTSALGTAFTGPGAALYPELGIQERFKRLFDGLKPAAKEGALESLKEIYETLEHEGKVQPGAFKGFLKAVDFQSIGEDSGKKVIAGVNTGITATEAKINLGVVEKSLEAGTSKILAKLPTEWGLYPIKVGQSLQEITPTAETDLHKLEEMMHNKNPAVVKAATEAYKVLAPEIAKYIQEVAPNLTQEINKIGTQGHVSSTAAVSKMLEAWDALPKGLQEKIEAGHESIKKGMAIINREVAKELQHFHIANKTFGPSPGGGGSKNALVPELKATGGYTQLGKSGERGRDSIPFMAGGMPVIGAPGETVAVFTHQQQAVANAALAGVGGLPGLFSSVSTPHYMAQGGVLGAESIPTPKVLIGGTIGQLAQDALTDVANAANKLVGADSRIALNFSGVSGGGGSNAANEALGKRMMVAAGWLAGEWPYLQKLWEKESGWSSTAVNKESGAAGIAQSLGHGPVELGNARAQIEWGLGYIKGRYGSPRAAWAHEVGYNWYEHGGLVEAAKGYASPALYPGTRYTPPAKTGKPATSVKPKSFKMPTVNLKSLMNKLGTVPGLEGIAKQLKNPEEKLTALGNEESLLSSMTSNPEGVFILPGDESYLTPTLAPGETIRAYMTLRQAEQEHERAAGVEGETEGPNGLARQGSLLSWIGGLANHRLVTAQEAGLLGQYGGAGAGVKVGVRESFLGVEGVVDKHEIAAQTHMNEIRQAVAKAAKKIMGDKKRREKTLHQKMVKEYKRYQDLKAYLQRLKTGSMKQRLKEAESKAGTETLVAGAEAVETANREAISNERSLTTPNKGDIASWENENTHLAQYIKALKKPKSKVKEAELALYEESLKNEQTAVGEALKIQGGSSSSIGTGGEFGEAAKAITTIKSSLPTLETEITTGIQATIPGLQNSINEIAQNLHNDETEQPPPLDPGTSESNKDQLLALKNEHELQLEETLSIQTAQRNVFANFAATIPHFDRGGPVLDDTLAMVHKGEYVVPRDGTLAMGGSASSSPPINVHNHMHIHGNAKAFIEAVDSRITHPRNVQAVSRQMMQRTQLIGGRAR